MPHITAIILTFNDARDTRACVESLFASSVPPAECIILDNGSASDEYFNELQSTYRDIPACTVYRSEENMGFSQGVNYCIKQTASHPPDFYLLINNDATVERDTLAQLTDCLNHNPQGMAASPSIYYFNEPDILWQGQGHFSKGKASVIIPHKNTKYVPETSTCHPVGFISGCVMMIRREALKLVGLLDTRYFFYAEDTDFCFRIIELGYQTLYVPHAKAYHKIDRNFANRANPFVFYHVARSKVTLLRQHFSPLYQIYALTVQYTLVTVLRIKQCAFRRDGWKALRAWFQGLADGFHPRRPRRY